MIYSTQEEFIQPLLQWNAKRGLWRLADDYGFEWGDLGFRKRLICKAGFEYDKASVPKLLHAIARPDGPWEAAALFHDRLYLFKGKLPKGEFQVQLPTGEWVDDPSPWTRHQADDLLQLMGKLGGASNPWLYKWSVKIYPINWFKGF